MKISNSSAKFLPIKTEQASETVIDVSNVEVQTTAFSVTGKHHMVIALLKPSLHKYDLSLFRSK